MIGKIKGVPPGALMTENKYKEVKDAHHQQIMRERNEHIKGY
jgi:hypothetical protein